MLTLNNSCALLCNPCNFPKAQDVKTLKTLRTSRRQKQRRPRSSCIRCSGGAGDLGGIRYGDAKRAGSLGRDPTFQESFWQVSFKAYVIMYTYICKYVRNGEESLTFEKIDQMWIKFHKRSIYLQFLLSMWAILDLVQCFVTITYFPWTNILSSVCTCCLTNIL